MSAKSRWTAVAELGQSVWYDNVARPALAGGHLAQLVDHVDVTGGTSNPSIFAKAVLDSDVYDDELGAAARRRRSGPAVVLTVWETVALRMASQAFAVAAPIDNEAELDGQEVTAARAAAEEGARLAREHGWDAEPRLAMARSTTWGAIVEVADELDASLVVCGTRGLSGIRGLVLGSVSGAVLHHARRPVLVAPEPHPPTQETPPAGSS